MSSNSRKPDEITPKETYLRRREFLKTSIYAGAAVATAGLYRAFHPLLKSERESAQTIPQGELSPVRPQPNESISARYDKTQRSPAPFNDLALTSRQDIIHYNNFYEFSTDKEDVAEAAQHWNVKEWSLEVGGDVEQPFHLNLSEIFKIQSEQRIYRFRCVEGWSMVIPWQGFPLARLIERAKPRSSAKYVSFESFFDPSIMTGSRYAGIPLPYREGLRLDEALHPLAFMATGLYGENLLPQNGPAVRLVVPWKYGFKSIKSVTKILITSEQPLSTWNKVNPDEYGFYSNVNPKVDHPRWSQKRERVIGTRDLIDTQLFNGYNEVESLYSGMDLEKYF